MLELTPAYGRDYQNQAAVRAAWKSGADFVVATFGPDMGRYASVRDLPKGTRVLIRYAQLRKVVAL